MELGVPARRIVTRTDVHNTRTELKALKVNTAGSDDIIIVSSSYHLSRVALWAKHYGLFPSYAPADPPFVFRTADVTPLSHLIPQANALTLSSIAMHEYLGIAHWFLLTRLQLLDE